MAVSGFTRTVPVASTEIVLPAVAGTVVVCAEASRVPGSWVTAMKPAAVTATPPTIATGMVHVRIAAPLPRCSLHPSVGHLDAGTIGPVPDLGRVGKTATVRLPVMPPLGPMLAKSATDLPVGEGWLFEPKWDGFRCIVFRDGDEVELGSRNERPLTRYFPELPPALQSALPERCVVDGELVVPSPAGLDFDALQQRIHPAASRVNRLAAETPTHFLAFDLLASGDEDLREVPLVDRRARLAAELQPQPLVHLSPCTTDRDVALRWFEQFEGAGLDGIVAKCLADTYRPDERTMVKVKHSRTADCVVAGFRWHKDGQGIGSLLLGLYDGDGELNHVGVCGSFTAKKRRELVSELEPLRKDALADHPWREWADAMAHATAAGRMPGSPRVGTPRRTCPGTRSGPSACARWRSPSSPTEGSGTMRSSCGGGTIGSRGAAPTTSSRWSPRSSWRRSWRASSPRPDRRACPSPFPQAAG